MHKKLSLWIVIATLAAATSAYAAPRKALDSANKPDMSKAGVEAALAEFKGLEGEKREEAIKSIEEYLTGISSVIANFKQHSADGSTGDGKFFMKRPGKVRWQYNEPTPILLVSDGKTLTYYDPGLKQVTYVGVDDTLAGFIAQKEIKLDSKTVKLTSVEAAQGLIRISLVQRKKPDEGSLTLEFADKPMQIKRMISIDATGNETQVTLENPQVGPVLDDKLFVFVDPRGVNDKRNKKK